MQLLVHLNDFVNGILGNCTGKWILKVAVSLCLLTDTSLLYEGAWFSAGRWRQGEWSGNMPVIDAAVGNEYNYIFDTSLLSAQSEAGYGQFQDERLTP